MFRRVALGVLGALVFGSAALAGDLPFVWYVGANGGYGEAHWSPFALSGRETMADRGPLGGGQVGGYWQTGHFFFGFETDLQAADQNAKGPPGLLGPTPPNPVAAATASIDWFGTFRGRLGVEVNNHLLLYVTGGVAYGSTSLGCIGCAPASNTSTLQAGWTVGAGAEVIISTHWSAKIEYLHLDLGSEAIALPAPHGSLSSGATDEILRVGINYRFGSGGECIECGEPPPPPPCRFKC